MLLVPLLLLAVSASASVSASAHFETIRLDGWSNVTLQKGPRFRVPSGQCSGYLDLRVPHYAKQVCGGQPPLALRVSAHCRQQPATVNMRQKMRVLRTSRATCHGDMIIGLEVGCSDHPPTSLRRRRRRSEQLPLETEMELEVLPPAPVSDDQ